MRRFAIGFAVWVLAAAVQAQPAFDARLTDYAYPYPVQMFPLRAQAQQFEMAYMDVPAKGTPNGKTVLLLHGKNFSGAYWSRTIDALTSAGFRVIVPDQIGFGKSSKPELYQFSFQALASQTKQLLDRLGVVRVSVVGHSMGGMLAARFALMHTTATERVALVNPIGLEDWKRLVPYTPIQQAFEAELKKPPEDVKEYMRKNYFAGEWKPEYDALTEIQAGWRRGPDARLIAWNAALTADMIFTQPVLYEFEDLKMPTLLIIGQRDRTALGRDKASPEVAARMGNYPELGRRAAQAIPNAKLVEIEGAGHVPQVEDYAAYIEALKRFLAAED